MVDESVRCLVREDLALVRRISATSPTVSFGLAELFEHRTDQRSSTERWPIVQRCSSVANFSRGESSRRWSTNIVEKFRWSRQEGVCNEREAFRDVVDAEEDHRSLLLRSDDPRVSTDSSHRQRSCRSVERRSKQQRGWTSDGGEAMDRLWKDWQWLCIVRRRLRSVESPSSIVQSHSSNFPPDGI